jgi:hypothetical protein
MATSTDFKVKNGLVVTTTATILGNDQSLSTTTGALIVAGGMGVGGNLYVGGTINGNIAGSADIASTATNIDGGTAGQTPYQTAPGVTSFYGPGTAGQLLVSGGTSGPLYTNTSSISVGGAELADKWTNARTISFTGDTTGTFSIDGSGDVLNVNLTIQPDSVTLGTDTTGDYVATGSTSGYGLSGSTTGENQIFTVTSNATSTNDISTIVFRDNLGGFSAGKIISTIQEITSTTNSTSTTTGALVVSGGVGIGGNLYVNGDAFVKNSEVITSSTIFNYATNTTLNAGTDTAINTTTGVITVWNISTLQSVTERGAITNKDISITTTTNSTSTTSGALVVTGGIGVGGNIYVGGNGIYPRADNTGEIGNTTSTWANGQFTNLTVNSTLDVRAAIDLSDSDVLRFGASDDVYFVYNGSLNHFELQLKTDANNFKITDNGVNKFIFNKTGILEIVTTTNAVSTATGSLVVGGGVGIGGNLYVGGEIVAQKLTIEYTTVTTNIIQTDDIIKTANTTQSLSTVTGALVVGGGVGIGGNLYVGGTINGNISGTLIGNAESVSTVQRVENSTHYITFVDSNNEAPTGENIYTTSSFTINPSTGNITVNNRINFINGSVINALDLGNNNITGVHNIVINDPGTNEGIEWNSTNNWKIYESPDDLSNNTGNLQFVTASTRRFTIRVDGSIDSTGGGIFNGTVTATNFIGNLTGSASQINTTLRTTNAAHYLTFVDSNNTSASAETLYTTSTLTINPSTSRIGITQSNPSASLHIGSTSADNSGFIIGTVGHYYRYITVPPKTVSTASTETFSVYLGRTSNGITNLNLFGSGWNLEEGCIFEIHRDWGLTSIPKIKSRRGSPIGELTFHYTTSTADYYDLHIAHTYQAGVPTGQQNTYRIEIVNNGAGYFSVPTGVTTVTNSTNLLATDHNINSAGVTSIPNITTASSTTTGALVVSGGVGIGGNLYVGGTISGSLSGSASQIETRLSTTNSSHYLTFVDSNNSSATSEILYTTSTLAVNPSTARVGLGTDVPLSKLHIKGSTTSGGIWVEDSSNSNASPAVRISGNRSDGNVSASFSGKLVLEALRTDSLIAANKHIGTIIFGGNHTDGTSANISYSASISAVAGGNFNSINDMPTDLTFRVGSVGQTSPDVANITFGSIEALRIKYDGKVGINTNTPDYTLEVNGSFAAVTKSFVIPHPTKPGMKLRYGSLEGPENGVYIRGTLKGSNTIYLPNYWHRLVDPDSITVNLTPIGKHQNLYIEEISNNKIIVKNSNLINKEINCFYTIFAERVDVEKLKTEI